MYIASHIDWPLVNPHDISIWERKRNIRAYERGKTCFGLYVLAHRNGQNLSFLSRKSRRVISLSMRCLLVYKSMHSTDKIGGAERAHWVHSIIVSAINLIQNTAPVHWIFVKSNTFFHSVCQIENAITQKFVLKLTYNAIL